MIDWKGPSYAMRSIQKNLWEAAGMTKRGRFPVLHWKKEETLLNSERLPPAPAALEGKISKAGKDRGRGSSILFSSRELQDRRSIRNGRRLHFVGRNRKDPIHSGNQSTLFTWFIDRQEIDELFFCLSIIWSSPDFLLLYMLMLFLSKFLVSMKREREEQMDPIPYIEDSFLSKIFVKCLCYVRFFSIIYYRNSSYPRQLPTTHPYDYGGAVRLWNRQ